MSLCPCSSGDEFSDCCAPYLKGKKKPETAEVLLRSRYTAHTYANIDYIQKTHHPAHRAEIDIASTKDWAENSDWLSLDIRKVERGGASGQSSRSQFVQKTSGSMVFR